MVDGSSKVLTINDPDSLNNDAGVTSVAISPNGQLVAAGSLDTVVRIWDVATAQLVERLRGHRDSVYSVAFTPDGKGLVSGSLDKTLKYWDVSGLMSGGVKGRKEGQAAAAAAAQGGTVAANGGSGSGVRKDGEKGSQCTMNFTGHKVRFYFSLSWGLVLIVCRIMCCLSRCLMMDSGSFRGQKIVGCSFGIRGRRLCSACCKAIKIRVSWCRFRNVFVGSLVYLNSDIDRSESCGEYTCDWEWGLAGADMCVFYFFLRMMSYTFSREL